MSRARAILASVRRIVVGSVVALAGLYLVAVVTACTLQRQMLYFPDVRVVAPEPPIAVVRLTTADHERLVAWWLAPKGNEPVILHFGGNGDSLAGQAERWRIIDAAGAGVLAVGYRGYSGSTGRPTEAGLTRDAEAAYAWLAARYPADRIVIYGHSLGSGVAVRLASAHPARALVLESPFTSAVDVARLRLPWAPVDLLMQDRYDSAALIGKVRMPVLIIHGERDQLIPVAQGERLFALAPNPKSLVLVPGGGHNDLVAFGIYDRVWLFLGLGPSSG